MDKKKKAKRDFFVRLTRDKSKKEIQKIERNLKRELTKQERKKIIRRNAAKAKRTVTLGALMGMLGIATPLLLNSGEKAPEEITINFEDTTKEDSAKKFREEVAEAAKTTEESEKENEEITFASEAELLKYLKNEYIEEYEKVTGDTELTTDDIEMIRSNQDYVMVTADGVVVTHGSTPDIVRNKLEKDGVEYSIEHEQVAYYIKEKNGNVIDGVIIMNDKEGNSKLRRLVHGDNYDEMMNSSVSAAVNLGDLIPDGMDGVCQWENNFYRNRAIETVRYAEKYKEIQNAPQVQQDYDDGR